ncbi:RHOMBOID-like protein 12, mitochondrial [Sesamum angolense]|uniref:RHOMBOID-like protein 12, mitochondrial n=1 Tax=Sesamum angolense TaxID=2727404 RepID=A0AAE2BYK6_9LAMI|nr:RHOMBOID-like protein 12, mitochondrial [Sesamum angolense]
MDHVVCVDVMWPDSEDKPTLRSIFRRLTTDGVVIGLIVTNVAVFLLWRIASPQFMVKNFMIGRTFGPEYLLKLYLSGAVVGSIFYLAYHAFIAPSFQRTQMGIHPSKVPGLVGIPNPLGASGAVNAIMLLDIFLFPSATLYFNFFIPIPAILLGIFMVGKDVLRILEGDHEVSGSAHLGGATVAALAWAQSRKGRFRRF